MGVNENIRVLKYKNITSVEGLKKLILSSLKLPINECSFEDCIKAYFLRQPKLKIKLVLNEVEILQDIESRITKIHSSNKFPEKFQIGNPHNRWDIVTNSSHNKKELRDDIENELSKMKHLISILKNYFEVSELN